MADIKLSTVVGGGGLPKLAPDLTFPSSLFSNTGYSKISGINAVGSLTTALSLTGKFAIDLLQFENITPETMTVKLTVDSVVIWNDSFSASSLIRLIGSRTGASNDVPATSISCDTSLLLELQTTADASVDLTYLVRPIL